MNGALPRFAVTAAPDARPRLGHFIRAVGRRIEPKTLLLALAILVVVQLSFHAAHYGQNTFAGVPAWKAQGAWRPILLTHVCFVGCIVLAVLAADEAVAHGARRWPTYLGALLVGSAVAAVLQWALNAWIGWQELMGVAADMTTMRPLQLFLNALFYGTFGTFVYVNHRTSRLAADRMRAAELARAQSRRRTLESRLQAMQARVEPQFLFNTLAQVGELYERDPVAAGQMLDDLISYLRAALPHLRESSSTLGRELDLARAYLCIMRVRLGDRLSFEIDVSEEAKGARMPPMMLLPLIDHALVYGLQPADEQGSIRIETVAVDGRLRLSVADSGVGFVPGGDAGGLASIGERLNALYGSDARFVLERMRDRGTRATLEIPYEVTDLRDR